MGRLARDQTGLNCDLPEAALGRLGGHCHPGKAAGGQATRIALAQRLAADENHRRQMAVGVVLKSGERGQFMADQQTGQVIGLAARR